MTTFHPFPRLPFELRARVWELTVEPRTVDVRVKHERTLLVGDPPYLHLVSSTPVPAPIQTCQEARNQGLYQKAFSEIANSDGTGWRYIWVNLDIDLISIGTSMFEDYKQVAPLIQRLKFERENSAEWFYYSEVHSLRLFVNVKEIYVVCADGMRAWHEATEEHYWPCGEENVFMIDPDNGQMMLGTEMDKFLDQELKESYRRDDYEEQRRSYWLL